MSRSQLKSSGSPVPLTNRQRIILGVRYDFLTFVKVAFQYLHHGKTLRMNWHHRAIACQLERVERGEIKRLLITMQPRALKSLLVSVMWPAWMIGKDPSRRFIAASYSQNLSEDLAQKFRALLEAPFYKEAFGGTVLTKFAANDLKTSADGGRFSTSVGGTALGRGGDIAILDDPQKGEEAATQVGADATWNWLQGTFFTRLDDKSKGAIVVVMQRLHENDVAGRLIRSGADWTHLDLPSIALTEEKIDIGRGRVHVRHPGEPLDPERESLEQLNAIEREVGSTVFSAQYLQRPQSTDGNIIRREHFRTYSKLPDEPGSTIISCDLAFSAGEHNDYSVMIVARVHGRKIYVLDIWRDKASFPDQKRALIRLCARYRPTKVIIEKSANGPAIKDSILSSREAYVPTPSLVPAKGSKEERLHVHSDRVANGEVFLPENAPWKIEFVDEVVAFPQGRYDDQVDALSLLLDCTRRQNREFEDASEIGGSYFISEKNGWSPPLRSQADMELDEQLGSMGWHEPTDHLATGPA